MIRNFRKITDNLYRGGNLSPKDVLYLKKKFGINKIVTLDADVAKRIDKATKLLGIKHVIIPIDETKRSIIKLLSYDLRELLGTGKVFIGCLWGKDRTGLVVALFKCKYLGMDPEDAIDDAKSLGFGIGVDPKIIDFFEKLIRKCKPCKDINNTTDIVSNEREYISDNRDSIIDEGRQGSFAPYLSVTRQNPQDAVYNFVLDQPETRENYKSIKEHNDQATDNIPMVGIYNNDAGLFGAGPAFPAGGFISE